MTPRKDLKATIAKRLKDARLRAKWSQSKLAKESGVSVHQINRYEHERSKPTDVVLKRLATVLGVKYESLTEETYPSQTKDVSDLDKRMLTETFERMLKLPVPEEDLMAVNRMLELVIYKCKIKSVS